MKRLYLWLTEQQARNYFTLAVMVFVFSFLVLPTSKMVNNVFYGLTAIPAVIALALGRWKEFVRHPNSRWFLLFWLWMFVPGILSGDGQYFRHLIYVLLFVATLMVLIDPAPFYDRRFARTLFWVVCLYVVGSTLFYWSAGVYLPGERVIWLPARMTGPIYTSMWLVACLGLATPVWVREHRRLEGAVALSLVVFIVTYVLQSRTGLVGIFSLFLCFFLASPRKHIRWVITISALFIVISAAFWFLRESPGVERLFKSGDSGRFQLWSVVINDWARCGYLFGCGLTHKFVETIGNGHPIAHPHNIYLSLGVYSGAISLILFSSWILSVLYKSIKTRNQWYYYLVPALVMLSLDGSMIIGNPDELWLLVFLPAGLICAHKSDA